MNIARDLVKFGEAVDFIESEIEAAERWQARIKGEEKLKDMQRQELEDAKRRSGFNWLRDGEHCNKLFFAHINRGRKANRMPDITVDGVTAGTHKANKRMNKGKFSAVFEKRHPDPEALEELLQYVRL